MPNLEEIRYLFLSSYLKCTDVIKQFNIALCNLIKHMYNRTCVEGPPKFTMENGRKWQVAQNGRVKEM